MDNNNDLKNIFQQKFKRIYILSLITRKDRQMAMKMQMWHLGLDRCSSEYLQWYWAVPFRYNDIIIDAFNKSGKGKFTTPNEYDCARNHYNIVKIAYEQGLDNVLIMEDDILFVKYKEYIKNTLENIPEDYDILQFGGFTTDPHILDYTSVNDDIFWVKHKSVGVWNASMYALSRRGMEYYLSFMDKFFWVADGPLYKAPLNEHIVNTYLCRKPIVIQADKDAVKSDLRSKETDSIDYNLDNIYECQINKSDFFNTYK